jgi:PAS domain S-box-containing protein
MSLEALAAATYPGRDLDRLERVAHQIPSAIESSRLAEVLVSSEKRLRSVLDSSRDAVITIEAAGLITGVNAGAVSMFGYPPAQFEGKELRELAPKWSLSGSSLWDAGDSPGRDVEIDARRSNGSSFTVGGRHRPTARSGRLRDITERKSEEDARIMRRTRA